jgi:flotillin
MFQSVALFVILGTIFFLLMILMMIVKWYNKVPQGKVLVRTGAGGTNVSFSAMFVIPVLHKVEIMDISLKELEISRMGKDGLICKDNIRADIKVAFYVRVNKAVEDVIKVAQTIGVERASQKETLVVIFDAKFSEALKTIGRRFDFVDLYSDRDKFKNEIVNLIGTDLNGYILDDCAIDYLEQTPLEYLKADNILDSQGIKKITEITAQQKILANQIKRDEEKVIKKQDVEAKEAILELSKQLTETEEKQNREIAVIRARERAEADKVAAEEKLKADLAKIKADEESSIAEENKQRQVIVAQKSKERTAAVEHERVEKDRLLEANEKERVVSLAQIEKEKVLEAEKKNIQDVIRERVMVERSVVEEEEKIKNTRAYAEANRSQEVAVIAAQTVGEEAKIKQLKAAEAAKLAAAQKAEQTLMEADAARKASEKQAEARKILAEAKAAEEATIGLSEVQVMEAKAQAVQKQGEAEANVLEKKALAEAKGIQAKAKAEEEKGTAEANVLSKKMAAEAKGIDEKAAAMKKLDGVGKEHEEFKLRLEKEKAVELAGINIQKDIASAQAAVISEALKVANIDIVGGETMFFDQIVGSITKGKQVDRMIGHSEVLTEVKQNLLGGDGDENVVERIQSLLRKHGVSVQDVKDLSIAALIMKLSSQTKDPSFRDMLTGLLSNAKKAGIADSTLDGLGVK